ncbi:MAG TPA: SulP family inorganic anion transporter [Saprospiraceae bacterium]|jgi:MFS superfamily sulfate permease-like transporter|nr:SulP family inorganic anion transporter [Saprospiraceae bacterium]MCC6689455.1 SulP family inorganic anion transporter [Saprospiraceae bacterium]HMV22969.1 SulP family inorganic anion transporter [Saprospiraceae bacterium]HMX84950.1 SulP family inorganic anion transporter [Saprospiraceae bacterium]HMZ74198.1 SulP family inorganic anion transporter [Saprospiraceae bacterium]
MSKNKILANLKYDFPSGLVVFLVALPLCLGIAMASGAPLFSGIIAGVVGGIVIGSLSNSHISVSGPAAGLTAIIISSISTLGSFEAFLTAVFLAGVLQLMFGFLRAGSISNFFPNNVIEGMLVGIGIIIILKQIPKALGSVTEVGNGLSMFGDLVKAMSEVQPGVLFISLVSLSVILLWDKVGPLLKMNFLPSALLAVICGTLLNELFINAGSPLAITSSEYLVELPVVHDMSDILGIFIFPDFINTENGINFSVLLKKEIWVVAATIAVVASVETLLCIEASDRMDPQKRLTDTDLELKAQGVGNMISSLIGGLPMTSVVVRSSANKNAGARTKLSTIVHGMLLLVSVMTIPTILNRIPLSVLAAILLVIGFKLAKPSVFRHFMQRGKYQAVPFLLTVVAVVFTDLLTGVALGMGMSIFAILRGNMKRAYYFRKDGYHEGDVIHIHLAQEVSFLNKAAILFTLDALPNHSKVIINASDTVYIAHDILDSIREFKEIRAALRNIDLVLVGFKEEYQLENTNTDIRQVSIEHDMIIKHRKRHKVSSTVLREFKSIQPDVV